jgi:hypothetical protein
VDRYLEQADFIRESLGYQNLEFRNIDVHDLNPELVATFDVVLCVDILYHLGDPIRGMKAMGNVATQAMLVDTALMRPKYVGRWLRNRSLEHGIGPATKGVSRPTPERRDYRRKRGTFLAVR